ncbi:MAG: hypothetical protein K8S00_06520 [Bacteroidales bacterium]|nr:hypothetical protein [Bacteroidales bacterium]
MINNIVEIADTRDNVFQYPLKFSMQKTENGKESNNKWANKFLCVDKPHT